MGTLRRFFVSVIKHNVPSPSSQHKDLKIAALEGLLEDKKRELVRCEERVLRRGIRSLQRQLERIERKQNGI